MHGLLKRNCRHVRLLLLAVWDISTFNEAFYSGEW